MHNATENWMEAHYGKLNPASMPLTKLEKNARFFPETNSSIIAEVKKKNKTQNFQVHLRYMESTLFCKKLLPHF